MKIKNLAIAFVALASAWAAPLVATAAGTDGNIRSINAMPDYAHSILFPNPTSPLKAGQDVYILVRLLNLNYGENMSAPTKVCPWTFVRHTPGATPLTWPKLGLSVGGNVRYAEYSELGPNGETRVNSEYSYYTDLYFKYTVQTGDLGLPIKILQADGRIGTSFSDFLLANVNTDGVTYNDWDLVAQSTYGDDTSWKAVKFRYGPETVSPAVGGVPSKPKATEVRTYTFIEEGVYVQSIDYDSYSDKSTAWRTVYPNSTDVPLYVPAIVGSGEGDETRAVYLWSSDENVFIPVPSNYDPNKTLAENGLLYVKDRWVLPVTILKGDSRAEFKLKGGSAAAGATATIYLSPTTEQAQSDVGETLAGSTVTRTIEVVTPPPPTVSFEVIPDTVTCKTNYEEYAAQLIVKMSPTADHDVTVTITAELDGTGDLADIYAANLLGISEVTTGAAYEDRLTTVKVPANAAAVPLYLYTLGWTAKTQSKGIKFKPSVTDPSIQIKETTASFFVKKSTSTITSLSTPSTVSASKPFDVNLTLSDNYANLSGADTGYNFILEFPDDDEIEPQSSDEGDFSYRYDGDGEFTLEDITFDLPAGEYTVKLTAVSPNKSNKAYGTFSFSVGKQPAIVATIDAAKPYKIHEGGSLPVKFALEGGTRNSASYAFLVPKNGAEAYVNTDKTPFKTGVLIQKNATEAVDMPEVEFLDGTQALEFDVVLSKSETVATQVSGWDKGTLFVTVTNVVPYVTYVTAAGHPVANGATLEKSVPKGVETAITVGANDVPADLDCEVAGKQFKTKIVVYDGTAATYEYEGNPEGHVFKHTFLNETTEGTLVYVYVKDKDMSAYPTVPNWSFRVLVDATPRVTLAYGGEYDSAVWPETEANGHSVLVGLSIAAPVELKLEVTAPVAGDDGYLKFKTNSRVAEKSPGVYEVTLPAGLTSQELIVYEMDGTADTAGGIEVNARVTTDTESGYGKKWCDYYEVANPIMPRVQNVAPVPSIPMENAPTNGNFAAYKTFYVDYKLASDVTADIAAGIKVVLSVDGTDVETVTGLTDKDRHTFTTPVQFTSPGTHFYTVTFYDKDDQDYGTARSVYYIVLPTKSAEVRAHGPADRLTTANGHSKRYDAAKGLGAGRVYATQGSQGVTSFATTYSVSVTEAALMVNAAGYLADGSFDTSIDSNGNFPKTSGTDYNYTTQHKLGQAGYDSYFYAWVCDNTKDSDGLEIAATAMVDPGQRGNFAIPLQDYDADKIAYDRQYWEAVFSREYLKGDNCGDMNLDGIPDLVLTFTGWKGTFSSAFDTAGTLTGNDLEDLSAANDDVLTVAREGVTKGDFLPTMDTAALGSLIPGLPVSWTSIGMPFDAITEIRGYHKGLNDALTQLGISSVQSDRFYEVDDGMGKMVYDEEKCTISELEYMAWKDSGLPAAKWSPERPTDPTTDDTDGDGYTDGFEYYFWYRAHVGYMENGEHKYLTGRRYNPTDPSNPTVITSAEIEALMDPCVPGDKTTANTRDTDNDGLPDAAEFELGTNPFDYDTDNDGLPDGFEVMYNTDNETRLDPLLFSTSGDRNVYDSLLNPDGDAMAYECVENYEVLGFLTDDGTVVYRAINTRAFGAEGYLPVTASLQTNDTPTVGWKILTADITGKTNGTYLTTIDLTDKFRTDPDGKIRLSVDLTADKTWNVSGENLGLPAFLSHGTVLVEEPTEGAEVKTRRLVMTKDDGTEVTEGEFAIGDGAAPNRLYAAFQYGELRFASDPEKPEFGLFAVCGDAPVNCSWPVVYVHSENEKLKGVYLIHHVSYQLGSYDPRTAWLDGNAKSRGFTTYDEFLALAFHYHVNTRLDKGGLQPEDLIPTKAMPWSSIWAKFVTSPFTADTDEDGMPDGWELYVMAGPQVEDTELKAVVLAAPSGNNVNGPISGAEPAFLNDYLGVSTIAAYPDCETIAAAGETWLARGWRNKKFATDPWNDDTDGDGIPDEAEGSLFIYGDPLASGAAGGGLDPCSWDTDGDGLPDPWEAEFPGVFTAGNVTQTQTTTSVDPTTGATNTTTTIVRQGGTWDGGMDGTVDDANADYDHDGLLNWQEYLVGTMRAWRYDDTFSSWSMQSFSDLELMDITGDAQTWGQYWYDRLVCQPNIDLDGAHAVRTENPEAGHYEWNQRLVNSIFDPGPTYFSLCTNEWDTAKGGWYYFKDGVYHDLAKPGPEWSMKIGDETIQYNRFSWWTYLRFPMLCPFVYAGTEPDDPNQFIYPTKYICCDPTKADTDNDGMDDYYELFHGMNPLLGKSGQHDTGHRPPVDIVFEAYGGGTIVKADTGAAVAIWSAENNFWLNGMAPQNDSDTGATLVREPVSKTGSTYDFVAYPWLGGLATADPDGDNIRNQEEAIMPKLQASSSWHHTDPTPLWMTDFSYAKSLTYRYYRPVSALGWEITLPDAINIPYFEYDLNDDGEIDPKTERWDIRSFPGYDWDEKKGVTITPYTLHEAFGPATTIYSFEENEGYDSDHDYLSDFEEAQGKTKAASDPQDSDDPLRRQAMWFDGTDSFLQTPLAAGESAPYDDLPIPPELPFLYFTVECWARPDDACDLMKAQTIVERAIWTGNANAADEKLLRKNFQIGIREGRWYAKYDSSGTDANQPVEVTDGPVATKAWTHLAATYDGAYLRLYVNGTCSSYHKSSIAPEHGTATVSQDEFGELRDGKTTYSYSSLLVGAGAANFKGILFDYARRIDPLDPTTVADYEKFYKGYVDEVRIWDGARSATQILADYKKRYTKTDCADNRQQCLSAWLQYADFTDDSAYKRPAELRYHFTFDHLPGATKTSWVLATPAGFSTDPSKTGARAKHWSRPDDYVCRWWNSVDSSIKSKIYTDLAWVPWIGNTVAHLPRPDGTTLDSVYWSTDYAGSIPASSNGYLKFDFPLSAEYVSKWTQMGYVTQKQPPFTTPTRHDLVMADKDAFRLYSFTLRHRTREGSDLLPFGGAYPKRISLDEGGMWDENGPADAWAETGTDADNNGLPDWWETYAMAHYGQDLKPGTVIGWDTAVNYNGIIMPAYQAYLRDLAKGLLPDKKYHDEYADATGRDEDGNLIWRDMDKDGLPDWWEDMYGVQKNALTDGDDDPDADGLSNYAEYLLSEVYPTTYGLYENYGVAIQQLNPTLSHSYTNQVVTDYFLRYSADDATEVTNKAGKSVFFLNEYFGEITSDHDMMEDWWESAYGIDYTSVKKYDPLEDRDEDGWSTFAECRAALWGGSFNAALIDGWTGAQSQLHVVDYPEPIVGVRTTYHGVQDISGKQLVIRTISGQSPRVDATFVIPPVLDGQLRYIGSFSGNNVLHGHLSPGLINPNSVIFYRAAVSSDKYYIWNCDWYQENVPEQKGWDGDKKWSACSRTHSGDIDTYNSQYRTWPKIELEGGDLSWETVGSTRQTSDTTVEFLVNGIVAGTINIVTGEYMINTDNLDKTTDGYVFRVFYTTRVGHEWPQTVYVSDTKELASDEVEGYYGSGRVKEGRNVIEAFMDLNEDGVWNQGEPFGSVRNVLVGWHKVPTVVIELKDDSPIMSAVALEGAAAEGTTDATDDGSNAVVSVTSSLTKTVRVTRRLINGLNVNEGKRLTERQLVTKRIVLDDHAYLTEADVAYTAKPDLDWSWLVNDAKKFGIENIESVTYSIDEVQTLLDGSTTNITLSTFVKTFSSARTTPSAVSPLNSAPVYSASPTLSFSASDDKATGYRLQIQDAAMQTLVYDSGVRLLPGRTGGTVGKPVYAVTPPVFADMDVYAGAVTNRVFADGSNYQWRVALVNAKFNTVEDGDYCAWADFQMDVKNVNRYPKQPTGYGNVEVAVRYYGPTNLAPAQVIVEAFENADFSGQPMVQLRLGKTAELLRSEGDVSEYNAILRGLTPGQAYFRAYFDQNNNGIRDRWETWGYANQVNRGLKAMYNPLDYTVEATAANWVERTKADVVIYMEDCDVNQNEYPDCIDEEGDWLAAVNADTPYWIEPENSSAGVSDPMTDTDGDGMPDLWENWNDGITDPLVADGDTLPEGQMDVMAYREETWQMVTIGLEDDATQDVRYLIGDTNQISRIGAALANQNAFDSRDGLLASNYVFTTYYLYGPSTDRGQIYGIGTNVVVTNAWHVKSAGAVTVALVHAQVYARCGFNTLTANPKAYESGTAVDTKAFTALDRYLVMRYFSAIGATPAYPSKYKSFEEYAMNAGEEVWKKWTLLPGTVDANNDFVADGWQLYVMYGTNLTVGARVEAKDSGAACGATSPWGLIGATTGKAPDGGGLSWRQEYNLGMFPSNPWNPNSLYASLKAQGLLLDGTAPFTDAEAKDRFDVNLSDTATDTDKDQITDFNEWQAYYYDCVKLAGLSAENAWSDGMTPDYFRGCGSSYLGLLFNGGEWINAAMRDDLGLTGLKQAGTRDYKGSGWDYWSVMQYSFNSEYAGITDTDLTFVLKYLDAVVPGECSAKTLPELREYVHTTWAGVERTAWNYEWDYDYDYTYTYDEATGSYTYQRNKTNDDDTDTRMTLVGDKLVTLDEMIKFFGGRTAMQKTIEKNTNADEAEEILIPEPTFNLTVRYSGDTKSVLLVEAYQVNPAYPEYGEQMTAFWNTSAEFNSGVAKVTLGTANSGSLKQGPARFVAYIDIDGNGKCSAGDTYGTTSCNVGYLGGDLSIALGEANPQAYPIISLQNGGSNTVSTIALVRSAINGKYLYNDATGAFIVQFPNNAGREALCPQDYVMSGHVGIDKTLSRLEGLDEIESVTYEVLRLTADQVATLSVTNLNHYVTTSNGVSTAVDRDVNEEITIRYSLQRDVAKSIAVAGNTADDLKLSFTVPTDTANSRFWLSVTNETTGAAAVCGGENGFVLTGIRDGVVVLDSDWLEENSVSITTGKVSFAVVLGNDKYGKPASFAGAPTATTVVNAGRVYDGEITVDVKHALAGVTFADGVTVAAYDRADLANPVAFTNDCASGIVTLKGLQAGVSYYVAAWYVKDAKDGRADASERRPYDSWGYVCNLTVSNKTGVALSPAFDAVAVQAKTTASVTNGVWLQDTDWNDNNVLDREEGFSAKDGTYAKSVTPVYGLKINGLKSTLFSDADEGDVMAYALVSYPCVATTNALGEAVWYVVTDLAKETTADMTTAGIRKGTPLSELKTLYTTYWYDEGEGDPTALALGRKTTVSGEAKVMQTATKEIVLVHAQVYAKYGFNPNTANGAIDAAAWVNTKAFDSTDKAYVVNYLKYVLGVSEAENFSLVDAKGVTYPDADPVAGGRGDGIPDGWELYVMLGTNKITNLTVEDLTNGTAKIHSPWNYADRYADLDNDGLDQLHEYDGGYYPTDPFDNDTDKDGITDNYAQQYLLKGGKGAEDFDGDGLPNYAEYLISEVFQIAKLDPRDPKTDDSCVDYFRKMGELYLGEIFTDHDQVDDLWEAKFADPAKDGMAYANNAIYDPSRDADNDGWSNYAEAKANTDPTTGESLVLVTNEGTWSRPEYPVPVIEAKVTYNGAGSNLSNLVFKVWNENEDADMVKAPDAVWKFSTATAGAQERYLGRMPKVSQQYVLTGGSVAMGTVKIKVLSQTYVRTGIADTNDTTHAAGAVYTGAPESAVWYLAAHDDGAGKIMTESNVAIGTIDYTTGKIAIDFGNDVFSGVTYGSLRGDKTAFAESQLGANTLTSYDCFAFADAHVLLLWTAKQPGPSIDGTYYLSDETCHVREGLNKFVAFADQDGNGEYTAGEPFGFVHSVDVGWQGASFSVDLTDTHPVFARLFIGGEKTGSNDRELWSSMATTITTNKYGCIAAPSGHVRVRVVRTAINGTPMWDMKNPKTIPDPGELLYAPQTVVMDKTFDTSVRSYLHEGDFLTATNPDIDWATLASDAMTYKTWGWPANMTNVTYRIVFGDGDIPAKLEDANTLMYMVGRVFETDENTVKVVTDPYASVTTYNTRPVFKWAITSGGVNYNSYSSFKVEVLDVNGTDVLYDSGNQLMPAYEIVNGLHYYAWTAPSIVDNLRTVNGQIVRSGSYKWRVTVNNAKYRAGKIGESLGTLTTAVNVLHDDGDFAYSTIPVTVKYTGPTNVLAKAKDMGDLKGKVRVQAFATADFSGAPISETIVTDDFTDTARTIANGKLCGLPANGAYYLRAYIDSNGNQMKDDWESWGAAGTIVAAGEKTPVGIYIEDADTDNDWLPDAWEFAENNWKGTTGWLSKKGKDKANAFVVTKKVEDAVEALTLTAGVSGKQTGAILEVFTYASSAMLACGSADYSLPSLDYLRQAVAKKVQEGTLKITSFALAPDGSKVTLGINADVAETIAGNLVKQLYDFTAVTGTDVRVLVYHKESLGDPWDMDHPVCDTTVTITDNFAKQVDVKLTGVDMSSGFFKVVVVQ